MKKLILLFLIISIPSISDAQVFIGGLADFELRNGQYDSAPYINQTPNRNLSIYTPNLRLFGLGIISDRWFLETALQSDYYEGETLSSPFFSLLNINWMPKDDSTLMLTAGRFVTPYGLQAERLLSSENPFVHLPLSHAFNVGVDRKSGVFSDGIDYDSDGMRGQSMVYQRGYSQGVMISNSLSDNQLRYEVAATIAPASSFFEYGQHGVPSLIARIGYTPYIWLDIGASFSYGSFMQRDELNEEFTRNELQSFRQTMIGTDLSFSYLYYSLGVEVNYSRWSVPDYEYMGVVFPNPEPEVWHLSMELRTNLKNLPGSYTGIRAEVLRPKKLRQDDEYFRFGEEVDRIELVAGYRIQRNVLAKASYLISATRPENFGANVLALQLSVGF